ncbi:hypothetical protein OHB35_14645 [Streptomyces phaeochromogenes]|uniref:Uncharacterized protein n=1 Tax=Streptomyces phaeochromogenes TaxID=1923 RepID=A0ABZ1H758_STRPH|nr:hypothetical protein [Streptomyces phaeochromogenes]WSD14384.1 hypothetical protein OHB35_14645 [Streptomyces phaeochromogenes]
MSRKLPLAEGESARTACARGLLRMGVEEKTGELLPAAALAERVGWAADLVSGMAAALLAGHWNTADVDVLAAGEDAGGRPLPSNAWMALRRLGWTVGPAEGIRVNDRIVRIAQETAGRTLRAAKWRADLTAGVLATWPADPATDSTPRAQATQGTLPRRTLGSGGPASGGTRSHGPKTVAPRGRPEPGRGDDQHTSPAAMGDAGRGFPPARSRHPSTVGRPHTGHYV